MFGSILLIHLLRNSAITLGILGYDYILGSLALSLIPWYMPCQTPLGLRQNIDFSAVSYIFLFDSISDVLILEQFVEGDGRLMSRSVTGLCKRQQFRITKLVKMAQKAGLMPGKDLGRRRRLYSRF